MRARIREGKSGITSGDQTYSVSLGRNRAWEGGEGVLKLIIIMVQIIKRDARAHKVGHAKREQQDVTNATRTQTKW